MNKVFYPKLAFLNLKKNHKTYVPYLFTCILTIMLFYALSAIGMSSGMEQIRGGTSIGTVMGWVTALTGGFSLIFLFYTNSFLIKQRKKELGLYQVMGMDKKNLSLMMLWETLITAAVSLGAGLLLGLALGKLLFLIFLKIIHFPVPLDFAVEPEALLQTVRLFLAVFLINLLWNLFRVARTGITELVGASRAGEKEPRGKWLLALLGLASLVSRLCHPLHMGKLRGAHNGGSHLCKQPCKGDLCHGYAALLSQFRHPRYDHAVLIGCAIVLQLCIVVFPEPF